MYSLQSVFDITGSIGGFGTEDIKTLRLANKATKKTVEKFLLNALAREFITNDEEDAPQWVHRKPEFKVHSCGCMEVWYWYRPITPDHWYRLLSKKRKRDDGEPNLMAQVKEKFRSITRLSNWGKGVTFTFEEDEIYVCEDCSGYI